MKDGEGMPYKTDGHDCSNVGDIIVQKSDKIHFYN